jgi:hypothetical protein
VALGTVRTTTAASKTVNVEVENTSNVTLEAGNTSKVLTKVNFDFNKAAGKIQGLVIDADINKNEALYDVFDNLKAYVGSDVVGNVVVSKDKLIVTDLNINKNLNEDVVIEIK